jgi:hypothetical protein
MYTVAATPSFALDGTETDLRPTLETFLTEEVGSLFHPPISFKMIEMRDMDSPSTMSFFHVQEIDFIYGDLKTLACLEILFHAAPLASLRTSLLGRDLDGYGATLFTRSDSILSSALDLQNATVSLPSNLHHYLQPGALAAFLRPAHAPSQLIRRRGPAAAESVVADVLSGAACAGLLPSDGQTMIKC